MTFSLFFNLQKDFHLKARFNTNKFASHQIFPMNHPQHDNCTCMLKALGLHCFDLALGCIYAKKISIP